MKTKINKIERLKEKLEPIEFDINSCDFTNLSEEERFYLKNFGIYNIKLSPNTFMLRVRIDGGIIESTKLIKLVYLAKELNLKVIITARAGLELHKIEPKDVLEVYNSVKGFGLQTHQSLTDNIRAIVTDPYDGIAADSYIDCYNIIEKIREEILNSSKYFGMLPRKFNTIFIGRVEPLVNPWGNDLLFALAKEGSEYGFNIYAGGKNSEVAKSVDIFIKPKDAKRLFIAILDTYLKLGLRGSRSKIRLVHLIEYIGTKRFRDEVESRFGKELLGEQTLLMQSSNYINFTKLKDGTYAKVVKCNYAEVILDKILKKIDKNSNIRLGVDQNLHLLNLQEAKVSLSSSILACAGAKYCPLSLWNIKEDVKLLNLEQFKKEGINIGFSGCLKGCGRHHHNHIGLVGLRTNMFGATQKALRVFIAASELPSPQPARLLYYAVPSSSIDRLFGVIINEYRASGCRDFNEFNLHLQQFSIDTLQLWFILRQLCNIDSKTVELFHTKNSQDKLLKSLQKLPIYPKKEELYEAINILSHMLWDK